LVNREENEGSDSIIKDVGPDKLHFWLVNVLQFFFGGMISTFIVFYFRSAVIVVAWPFFLILAIAFIANESLKRHFARIDFQISFLFLCIFLFMIFLVPVLMHEISMMAFLASGGISLIILMGFLALLRRFTKESFRKGKRILFTSVVSIYLVMNAFYFLGIIPPLPLSLQDVGIYHKVTRTIEGNYEVIAEPTTFADKLRTYISLYPTYHTKPDGLVYAYTAIFSPASFGLAVHHEWQKYDDVTKKWVSSSDILLPIAGGRDEGYRTYSINSGLTDGRWRVNVQTATGQLIGRMVFNVVVSDTTPETVTLTKK
jgi:hypothetical protein